MVDFSIAYNQKTIISGYKSEDSNKRHKNRTCICFFIRFKRWSLYGITEI